MNERTDSCSEQVEIIFSAIKSTVNEIGANAYPRQERSVTNHFIEIVRWDLFNLSILSLFYLLIEYQ